MAGNLAALDRRIAAAVDRFLQQVDKHHSKGLPDRERVETEFVDQFGDGSPDQAEHIATQAEEVAAATIAFDLRISSLAPRLVNLLISKDMLAHTATVRAHIEGREAALRVLDALPMLTWLEKLRKGQDPGPLPRRPDLVPSEELSARLNNLSSEVFGAGSRVATAVEMMADIIDLRLAYLNRFKLSQLRLNPEEIAGRIAQRLKQDPGATGLQSAWGLLQGTVIALVLPLVEEKLPRSTIRDFFERTLLVLIGEPLDADVPYSVALDLRRQEEALNKAYEECEATTSELHALAVAIVSETGGETGAPSSAPAVH